MPDFDRAMMPLEYDKICDSSQTALILKEQEVWL